MPTEVLRAELARVLREMGVDAADGVSLERPRNPEHGDWASNVALTLAGTLRRAPRAIAEEVAERFDASRAGVESVDVAGPGFINFRLVPDYLAAGLRDVLAADEGYGRSDAGGDEPVVVEFVSANPTGPLHPGHGRQLVLGDAISELLAWTGYEVHREYYYNDAGEQIDRLTRSVRARYQQLTGRDAPLPEDGYRGEYIADAARAFREAKSDRYAGDDSAEALEAIRAFSVRTLMGEIERDLADLGVHFDRYYLESSLYTDGRVDDTVARLRATGLVYDRDGAVWLKTTRFGDDKDRVMIKGSGHPTYFVPDVAYHLTKWERGFRRAINVQGADHHGTVARVRAGLQALGLPEGYPEYVLHQMVAVTRGGEEVRFSKRAGEYVTLRELFEEVGVDVTRYFFLMRRLEAQLVFDLDLALDQSDKNPVYKIQYAHARMCSIFRRGGVEAEGIRADEADLDLLAEDVETELVKQLLRFPEVVESAAAQHSPHLVCTYLEETASAVNSWYHAGNLAPELRVLGVAPGLSQARLVLARAVQIVLCNGLAVLGISAPERMERDEAAA
jgi:arginyl-tRNA synthetase